MKTRVTACFDEQRWISSLPLCLTVMPSGVIAPVPQQADEWISELRSVLSNKPNAGFDTQTLTAWFKHKNKVEDLLVRILRG